MPLQSQNQITVAEYLAIEASSREKHAFYRGEVFAMEGASERHNLIVLNVGAELRQQLKGKPYRVYPSDMRVTVSPSGLYTYPDVVLVCGTPKFEQPGDTLLNPTLLVEVLSESTEAYDRGKKSEQYRSLAGLTDYLLIAQDRVLVEHFHRQSDGHWLLHEVKSLNDSIAIETVGSNLLLAEIYLNVTGIADLVG